MLLYHNLIFKESKTIRLNATYYFIIKIPEKREVQQIATNHSSDTDFKDFMKPYKDYTKNHIHFSEQNNFVIR